MYFEYIILKLGIQRDQYFYVLINYVVQIEQFL